MMKKTFNTAMAALALLAASCSSESEMPSAKSADGKVSMTFTATQESSSATRTALASDGKTVNWADGDEVFFIETTPDGKNTSTLTVAQGKGGSSTTTLSASVSASATEFMGVYPASSVAYENSTPKVTLSATQQATAGGFDPAANLMVAKTTDQTLSFQQLCSYLKLTTDQPYEKIVVTADVNIAGKGEMLTDGDGKFYYANGTANTVTLVPASGSKIAVGTYFIAIAPSTQTIKPKKLSVQCFTEGAQNVKLDLSSETGFTLARGKVNNLGTVNETGKTVDWKSGETLVSPFCLTDADYGSKVSLQKVGDSAPGVTLRYSRDNFTWQDYTIGSEITLGALESVYFRAGSTANPDAVNNRFTTLSGDDIQSYYRFDGSSGYFHVSGNIMYLMRGNNNPDSALPEDGVAEFARLFYESSRVASARGLIMPTAVLHQSTYEQMFAGSNVSEAPAEISATTMAKWSCHMMFHNCDLLETVPKLPATTLGEECYCQMFFNCDNLDAAPVLPASILTKGCYKQMFYGCKSLENGPALPAMTLAANCYEMMFTECTALKNAQVLPATTLVSECYAQMFDGCVWLTSVTMKATTLNRGQKTLDYFLDGAGQKAFEEEEADPVLYVPASVVDSCNYNKIKGEYFAVQAISE